jgi:gas vesicle protein
MMDQESMKNAQKVVTGTLIGVLAGIMIAPRSGRETREMLKKHGKDTLDSLQDKLAAIRFKLSNKIEDLREISSELTGELKTQSQELIRRAEVLRDDLKVAAIEFADATDEAKEAAAERIQVLMADAKAVSHELSRTTKEMTRVTKEKLAKDETPKG